MAFAVSLDQRSKIKLNQEHPHNKHNEDNTTTVRLSPGELQGAKWRQLKRRNQAKAKNTPLSKTVSLHDDQTTQKISEMERHYNELPLVFRGADRAEQQPGTSRNKGHAA